MIPYEIARSIWAGVMGEFDERYGDEVRVMYLR
jgi:hypothetical protein